MNHWTDPFRRAYVNGKLAVSKTIEGASSNYVDNKYQYDHLGRLKTHKDPRIGNTTTTYYSGTNQVNIVTTPDGQTTTYDYEASSGRLFSNENHGDKFTYTQIERDSADGDQRWVYTWGDVPNPVKTKYDDLGRRVEMHTYKSGTWTGDSKPTGFRSPGDKTTWTWDGKTGLLNSKTDAAGQNQRFTYNDRGQIKQRTDAKSVMTDYTYFDTAADGRMNKFTGELKKIKYTPTKAVEFTYTRFGALKTVNDAAGIRTFTYGSDLQVKEEQLGDFYDYGSSDDTLKLIYGYASSGVRGRLTDFDLKAGSSYLLQDGYGYDAVTGRLNQVTGHSETFDISYLANSHLIDEVESGSFERHINRQTNSHRISSIENEWSQTDRVNFTYSYDTLGRVSTRVMTGTIEDAYGSNTTELRETFTYNDRHELTAAKTESKISGTYHELVGRKHALTYDKQGNRLTHSRNNHTTSYTPNNLNQYTARSNHGFLLVEGTSTNATVKVYETGSSEVTATRKNNYYFRDWDPDTTSTTSDYPEINIKEGTTVSATKNAWIPAVSETPITYDANGNLTADAQWTYTYDEENRLISMAETTAAATAGFPDTAITFKYDYLGRRVEKKVVRGTTTESHLRFVWRGWLLVAELNAASNNDRVKTYTWGPDISGSFGGAGGNGGVLIMKDHRSTVNESFYPAYDSQGNVTGLIDTTGNLDAAYEYDPFGKLIRYAGPRSSSMSLLYGTKYLDMETGLIYYGYRYYNPRQGRFINRDPIGEEGGLNLYGFVGNSPVNGVDFLGLCGPSPIKPRKSDYDRRDDDEIDRYDKDLEKWEDDRQDWKDCREDAWIREAGAITTQPNPLDNLTSAFDVLELLGKTQRNNGGSGDLNQNGRNGGSVLGNVLRELPYFGGLLGAIGDTITGVVNTAYGLGTFGASGTLARGLSQLGGGISSIVNITFRDVYAVVVGMGIGTFGSSAKSIGEAVSSLFRGDLVGFGVNLADMVADLAVPKYGWWNGLNWGKPQFGTVDRPTPINQGDYAGFRHDDNLWDALWIDRYQYSLTEHTPNGIFGGVYGILGTVPFTILNRKPEPSNSHPE